MAPQEEQVCYVKAKADDTIPEQDTRDGWVGDAETSANERKIHRDISTRKKATDNNEGISETNGDGRYSSTPRRRQ